MPAGKYYIGDLCYVMHDAWKECCNLFFPYVPGQLEQTEVQGEFTLKDGRRFANFRTAYGDGTYVSNINTEHSVDSGCIGCIRVEDIRDTEYDDPESLGAFVEFTEPFEVSSDQGLLIFGHVQIETAADDWDEEEEDCFSEEE
jgi:hypothetical protein